MPNFSSPSDTSVQKIITAKHSAKSDVHFSHNLFERSRQALERSQLNKLTHNEALQLLKQTEDTIWQLDISMATYGYSFTPEIHKQILELREELAGTITGKFDILNIRLAAITKLGNKKLSKPEISTMQAIIDELMAVSKQAEKIHVKP